VPLRVLQAVEDANEAQKMILVERVVQRYGDDLAGRTFALWGLAFKPNTDDMREAPSRVVIGELLARGASIRAYDPVALAEAARIFGVTPGLTLVNSAMAAVQGADALLIATEWREFRTPDFDALKAALRQPLVLDGRNLYEPALMAAMGIDYVAVGRGARVGSTPL
jgi:UDPglucose 6-dehydrogenase